MYTANSVFIPCTMLFSPLASDSLVILPHLCILFPLHRSLVWSESCCCLLSMPFSDCIFNIRESFSSVTASSHSSLTQPPIPCLSSSAADTPCTMCAQNPRRTVAAGAVTPTRSQVRRGRRCSPWGPGLFLRFNLRVLLDPGQLWHLQCRASVGRCFK